MGYSTASSINNVMSILKSNGPAHLNPLFKTTLNGLLKNTRNLSDNELWALRAFKGPRSKYYNQKLYRNIALTNKEQEYLNNIDSALQRMPINSERTYRVLGFQNKEDFDNYINDFNKGTINFKAYSFASLDMDGWSRHSLNAPYQAKLVIDSKQGRYLGEYFQKDEVIFPRNSSFRVAQKELRDNIFYSLLEDTAPL